MSANNESSPTITLPPLPADHAEWISHVASHPEKSLQDLIAPYKEYDAKLREVFAQQPKHPAIEKPNVVPIFAGREQELKIRARKLSAESKAERQCYLMPLKKADRKPDGSPAVVQSLKEFQTNFQLFSESALVDMDWSNVVVAGSAVVTSLLPVPEKHNTSKRALREYYHQKLAPASDVDLFLYGLTEEQALEKIKQIEQRIRDSILTETTTIRTKNAITIASSYPTRHVQIVLRIYRSVSEILTGFDVDCSCAAYDGSQVYASPRALAAYMTQVNTIDLTRRSPSYENRLSKYSHRGFEIHWPLLDRSRVDPTIFERSFGRTLGLARLLILEKLPKNTDREAYVDQRRAERGRPTINRWGHRQLKGNIKDEHDDEVADWVETDEVSDYHTFTIPYGPQYHARKIERLLYAKDLLLNAEWNRPKERETTLHRHPAFFGNADDVIGDCCGYCPEPVTPEDKEIAEEESKTYVSGRLTFIKDDPGRQAIGSFNPLTDDDWTEMAYVGNTARLCQAIVDGDLEHVKDWLSQEGADPNRRDYTGRTPLHLAVATSTPEIVQCLIDGGARIVARLVDGKTALHLAAMRGEAAMVKALLIKSEANEEKEAEKVAAKRSEQKAAEGKDENMIDAADSSVKVTLANMAETKEEAEEDDEDEEDEEDDEDSDIDMLDDDSENAGATTEGSMIRIDRMKLADTHENLPENADEDEPDVYDVNVVAWDMPVSALHLAIANGHTEVVTVLVQDFGADVLLPVKLVHDHNKSARAAILPIVLAVQLPPEKAKEMTSLLITLGASPAQADIGHATALHYFTANGVDLLSTVVAANRPAAQRAVDHLAMSGHHQYNPNAKSILQIAIEHRDVASIDALLELGAKPEIDFATYITSFKTKWDVTGESDQNMQDFRRNFTQPVFTAVNSEMASIVLKLLDAGADVNSVTSDAWKLVFSPNSYADRGQHSLLDAVRHKMSTMREFLETGKVADAYGYYRNNNYGKKFEPISLQDDASYLEGFEEQSYSHWAVSRQLSQAKSNYKRDLEDYNEWVKTQKEPRGTQEKKEAVQSLLAEFETLESQLLERGAKTLKEIYPDMKIEKPQNHYYHGWEPEAPKPFSPLVSFRHPGMTDEERAAYIKLFQACWDADLETIKGLTLAVWSEKHSPLKIAVQDTQEFSPFSIAVLRKHFDVARAILEIAKAQYAPDEQVGQVKHSLQPTDEDDDVSDDDEDHVQIYSEIVDDRFTIENIGEVQNQVKSKVEPIKFLSWRCPLQSLIEDSDPTIRAWSSSSGIPGGDYKRSSARSTGGSPTTPSQEDTKDIVMPQNLFQFAIYLNDSELLHFLIAMGEDHTVSKLETAEGAAAKFYRFDETDFLYAIEVGRVELIKEIVTRTGAGIPLDALVKKSGIEIVEKPKFYQGLSVHGQKRADWANAGREVQGEPKQQDHPPVLQAARLGNLESVEWFSSDAALRCYSEFTDNHRDDIRIQNLAKAQGGLEAAITKWLTRRSHLLIHCAVLGNGKEDSLRLLRQLCKTHPEALRHRSASGMTPLFLAFSLQRVDMVKILLEAGAEQTCRDNTGNNIVHAILSGNNAAKDEDLDRVRKLLDLIDPLLVGSLFTERTTVQPGAATPLARWLDSTGYYNANGQRGQSKMLQIILDASKGEDLGLVNGGGDTPLHTVVRSGSDNLLRIMLSLRPELLFRENATGRTPYEMAEDAFLAKMVFNDPPSLQPGHLSYAQRRVRNTGRANFSILLDREPWTFVDEPDEGRLGIELVWEVCQEFAQKSQGTKRKLVSLVEANEVAKRLARQKGRRDEAEEESAGDRDEEDATGDEVQEWYGQAWQM
jgi:ankyrin repeat protein